MNVLMKFSIFCIVFYASLSSANNSNNAVGGCLVQLLKAMGKLSADFQSNSLPKNPLVCYYMTELSINMMKGVYHGEISAKLPNEADCLIEMFDLHGTVFDIIKVRLIEESSTLDETQKQTQLEEARNELTKDLEKIVVDCPTNKEKFRNIFHIPLAIKNDTLEAHQTEYCLAKYAVDNELLELDDAKVWNPHNITPESVDCDNIVAAERISSEREVGNVIGSMPNVGKHLECIMDLYRTGKTFNNHVSFKVLTFLDLPKETKASLGSSHSVAFSNFMRTSYQTCAKKN